MKILIVDDDVVSRTKMLQILAPLGDCEVAENGQSAEGLFRRVINSGAYFDLITLDVSMPDKDGLEVLIDLREIEEKRNVSDNERAIILMVTASSDRECVTRCLQAGCTDYIVKPFTSETVLEKVHATINP